jgi:hemerythrin-like domain-containing protein
MKRNEALRQLSRDHHRALETALKLRRAGDSDAEAVREEYLDFWRGHATRHFRIEEEVMLPAYARYADPTDAEVARVLTDHVEIRRRSADLAKGTPTGEELNELGELLSDHVRHEERVLFPLIERRMPEEALVAMAQEMEEAERSA